MARVGVAACGCEMRGGGGGGGGRDGTPRVNISMTHCYVYVYRLYLSPEKPSCACANQHATKHNQIHTRKGGAAIIANRLHCHASHYWSRVHFANSYPAASFTAPQASEYPCCCKGSQGRCVARRTALGEVLRMSSKRAGTCTSERNTDFR